MKLYAAICSDRHIDTVVRVFDTPEKAIAYAKAFVKENCRYPEYIEEEQIDGCLYYSTYSTEEDFVMVEETWLNDEPAGKD
jgi:hypothetical protein